MLTDAKGFLINEFCDFFVQTSAKLYCLIKHKAECTSIIQQQVTVVEIPHEYKTPTFLLFLPIATGRKAQTPVGNLSSKLLD